MATNGLQGAALRVVDVLDDIPMVDRDTNGDLYEYMLGNIAAAGQNGQFRTPRHIIALMVKMMAPTVMDDICDPACGTAGFLVVGAGLGQWASPALRAPILCLQAGTRSEPGAPAFAFGEPM